MLKRNFRIFQPFRTAKTRLDLFLISYLYDLFYRSKYSAIFEIIFLDFDQSSFIRLYTREIFKFQFQPFRRVKIRLDSFFIISL